MKLILLIVVAILILALIVSLFIRWQLKKRLRSINGFVGVSKNSFPTGKIVGGVIDRDK